MLVFAFCLLWLLACLGVLGVWVFRELGTTREPSES
jgi:hypothetical protein